MAAFLIQIELPSFTDEMARIIPQHRAYVNKLFAEGRLLSYSVSQPRTLVWCVINAADEQEAMGIVLQLPLYPYFTDVICHPLLFNNTMPVSMPHISLN